MRRITILLKKMVSWVCYQISPHLVWNQQNGQIGTFSYENKQTRKDSINPMLKSGWIVIFVFPSGAGRGISPCWCAHSEGPLQTESGPAVQSSVLFHVIVQKVTQVVFWTKLWDFFFFFFFILIETFWDQKLRVAAGVAVFITPRSHSDTIALERQRAVYYSGAILSRDHYQVGKHCPEDL